MLIAGCFLFIGCEKDDFGGGEGLKGYYVDLNMLAKTSQFDRINQAIRDNELLSKYPTIGAYYYATRDLFFRDDGRWWSSDGHYGACRFMPYNNYHESTDYINIVQIVDSNTIILYSAWLWDPNELPSYAETLGGVNGGTFIGPLVYNVTDKWTYTYTEVNNKLILSNGYIYTVVDGGIIRDGDSRIMSKYNPFK